MLPSFTRNQITKTWETLPILGHSSQARFHCVCLPHTGHAGKVMIRDVCSSKNIQKGSMHPGATSGRTQLGEAAEARGGSAQGHSVLLPHVSGAPWSPLARLFPQRVRHTKLTIHYSRRLGLPLPLLKPYLVLLCFPLLANESGEVL